MYLFSIVDIFAGFTAQALCWTLLHSIWQALLLAVIAGIIMLATKRSTSQVRYNLLTATFLIFIAAAGTTFFLELFNAATLRTVVENSGNTLINNNEISVITANISNGEPTFAGRIISFFDEHVNLVIITWLLIVSFRSFRLFAGLHNISRIRHRNISSPGAFWNQRVIELAEQLKIKRKIGFLQSGIVKIPMVIGHFKPIILFPVALITALPQHEIEAVLLHELAHIRRKDYLVNMLQNFMEILFCFNPALLWVSSLIRTERENCCDDIAIANTKNKRSYINALISFQEYNLGTKQYANAFAGTKKDQLLQRVKRIIYNSNKTLNGMEKTFLLSCFIVAGTLTLVFSQTKDTHVRQTAKNITASNVSIDTVPQTLHSAVTIYADTLINGDAGIVIKQGVKIDADKRIYYSNGYEVRTDKTGITAVYQNGNKMSSEFIGSNREMLNGLIRKVQVKTEEQQMTAASKEKLAEELAENAGQNAMELDQLKKENYEKESLLRNMASENKLLAQEKQSAELRRQLEIKMAQLYSGNETMTKTKKEELAKIQTLQLQLLSQENALAEKEVDKNGVMELMAKLNAEKAAQEMELSNNLNSKGQQRLEKLNNEITMEQSLMLKLQAEKEMISDKRQLVANQQQKIAAENQAVLSASIIKDLESDGLIKRGTALNVKLNNEGLIINGVKQSPNLSKKYKSKYVKTTDWNFSFNKEED
ncbi:MAG: M56 family metallopeptidase [Ferruginibacter sp.]